MNANPRGCFHRRQSVCIGGSLPRRYEARSLGLGGGNRLYKGLIAIRALLGGLVFQVLAAIRAKYRGLAPARRTTVVLRPVIGLAAPAFQTYAVEHPFSPDSSNRQISRQSGINSNEARTTLQRHSSCGVRARNGAGSSITVCRRSGGIPDIPRDGLYSGRGRKTDRRAGSDSG